MPWGSSRQTEVRTSPLSGLAVRVRVKVQDYPRGFSSPYSLKDTHTGPWSHRLDHFPVGPHPNPVLFVHGLSHSPPPCFPRTTACPATPGAAPPPEPQPGILTSCLASSRALPLPLSCTPSRVGPNARGEPSASHLSCGAPCLLLAQPHTLHFLAPPQLLQPDS